MIKQFIKINRKLSQRFSAKFSNFIESEDYKGNLLTEINVFINGRTDKTSILESGGRDRPLLERHERIEYDGLDIEHKDKCNQIYDNFHIQSIEKAIPKKYDVICSLTLLEHVQNNAKSFRSMFNALNSNGIIAHYLPNKSHPYSLITRALGPKLSFMLLKKTHPDIIGLSGYPSFFDKCSVDELRMLCEENWL